MKSLLFFPLSLAMIACTNTSNSAAETTSYNDSPTPSGPVVAQPKSVEDVISAMQYRTEGTCANRDLKLHYMSTAQIKPRRWGTTEALRIVLYPDHSATLSILTHLEPGARAISNLDTTWNADDAKVLIDKLGTINVTLEPGGVNVNLEIESDELGFGRVGQTLALNKRIDFPEGKFNMMDCLPSIEPEIGTGLSFQADWGISSLASPILRRPGLDDVIPEDYQFLLYRFEGTCDGEQGTTFKQHYWLREISGGKLRLALYKDGGAAVSVLDAKKFSSAPPIWAKWRIINGKAVVAFFKNAAPFNPDKIFLSLAISNRTVTAAVPKNAGLGVFDGQTFTLESRYENAVGLDGNSCRLP